MISETIKCNNNKATLYQSDNISGMYEVLFENSIDLVVTSIPFGSLFTYSGKSEDIGNCSDGVDMLKTQFALHMRFHLESLKRVVKHGCNICIHIQQLLAYNNEHGFQGRRDFRGALIEMATKAGLQWIGEIVIPKNPQIIAQRLKLHSLMFVTAKRNARDLAPAVNDYVMIFQKAGDAEPVKAMRDPKENPDGWITGGNWINWARGTWQNADLKLKREIQRGLQNGFEENFELDGFQEQYEFMRLNDWLTSGLWEDIQETDVLGNYRAGRDKKDEKHVCPLQLEVIRRLIKIYSNPNETVLDPFNGIGSTSYVALEQGRNAVGFELKESYYDISIKNVRYIANKMQNQNIGLFQDIA